MSKPRNRNIYRFVHQGDEYVGTTDELIESTGLEAEVIWKTIHRGDYQNHGKKIGKAIPVYEFYKTRTGKYFDTGTMAEVAERAGIRPPSLGNEDVYLREFTGEYREIFDDEELEDESMITRRTINKVAPVPTERKYDGVEVKKQITVRPAAEKQFKVGEYAQDLHDWYFKGWNLKEG